MKGALIVFEGVNGAGKSTIIKNLTSYYDDINIPYSLYKFPNRNGPNGIKIDKYLKGEIKIKSKYDVLDMFAKDRKYVCEQIRADIREGKIVICDRYIFSAIAYQIPLKFMSQECIRKYCAVIGYFDKDMPMPDITFLVKGDFLRKRGIVTREIFHYVNSKQRELYDILYSVISQYHTNKIVLHNRKDQQYFVTLSAIAEVYNYINK